MFKFIYEKVNIFKHFNEQKCYKRRIIFVNENFINKIIKRFKIFGEFKLINERLIFILKSNDIIY